MALELYFGVRIPKPVLYDKASIHAKLQIWYSSGTRYCLNVTWLRYASKHIQNVSYRMYVCNGQFKQLLEYTMHMCTYNSDFSICDWICKNWSYCLWQYKLIFFVTNAKTYQYTIKFHCQKIVLSGLAAFPTVQLRSKVTFARVLNHVHKSEEVRRVSGTRPRRVRPESQTRARRVSDAVSTRLRRVRTLPWTWAVP